MARGLYLVADKEFGIHISTLAVLRFVPNAIVCLLSALAIHDIGTQMPPQLWIAIGRTARKPRVGGLPVRVVRFSGPALTYGVQTVRLDGVDVRVTSPARTVVDCFRYRNKIGLDVPLEALKDCLRDRKATVDEIMRAAGVLRAKRIMTPYLTAVLA